MAEVRKHKVDSKYNTTVKTKKTKKNTKPKKVEIKKEEPRVEEKKSLFVRFRIFCHGVKSEFHKVHWTTKDKLIKYSIMVIVFILAMSAFFYLIDVVFAKILSLFS